MVFMKSMKQVRRSVTLPRKLAEQVERIARKKRLNDNRVLVEMLEPGLAAQKEKASLYWRSALGPPRILKMRSS
jgi:hypothetical protein